MKKIAYVYDSFQMYSNSVSDILCNLACQFDESEYEQIVISAQGTLTRPLTTKTFRSLKTYLPMSCSLKDILSNADLSIGQKLSSLWNSMICTVVTKIPRLGGIYKNSAHIHYYNKIFRLEKPDVVIYFSLSPQEVFTRIFKKRNIPYISLLYDTFASNPCITPRDRKIESDAIANAVAYFVPNFFIHDYRKYYRHSNIYPFRLPLLIPKNKVLEAYERTESSFKFTYFGIMQAFRNADRIKVFFQNLGETLDVFSPVNSDSDSTYIFHKAVQQEQLYEAVAASDFLVAFDNSDPYAHYLPSKAYLYVSFTKPIIVFGDNQDSALIRFLDGYPYCYYHNINDPSLDGLLEFINANQSAKGFDEETYSRYKDYLPQAALCDVVAVIKSTANGNIAEM